MALTLALAAFGHVHLSLAAHLYRDDQTIFTRARNVVIRAFVHSSAKVCTHIETIVHAHIMAIVIACTKANASDCGVHACIMTVIRVRIISPACD